MVKYIGNTAQRLSSNHADRFFVRLAKSDEGILNVWQGAFGQDDGKYASEWTAKAVAVLCAVLPMCIDLGKEW